MSRLLRTLAWVAAIACAGCATRAPRDVEPPRPEPPAATAPAPAQPPSMAPPAVADAPAGPIVPARAAPAPDVWQRLRDGFAFADCPGSKESRRWQRVYTQGPDRFAALLERVLPQLEFVLTRIEARRLPTEFALLPIVESQYTPFAARGNRPAGIWQFMPVTARGLGLEIGSGYDGRLDTAAATDAALELLAHLHGAVGPDWRLVDMAFNAGEYRVRGALRRAGRRASPDSLGVSRITHEHLAKLNALACIVRAPRERHVTLPAFDAQRAIAPAFVEHALDLELAAALAGVDVAALRMLNPAHFGTVIGAGRSVMLPASSRERFAALLAGIEPASRTGWRRARPAAGATWASLAATGGVTADTLRAINGGGDGDPAAIARLLPPGAAGVPVRVATTQAPATADDGRYRVRSGDSLWRIARAFRVRVQDLLDWNALSAKKPLQPGQWLRVIAP